MYQMAQWPMVPRMRFSLSLSSLKKNCNALMSSCASVRVVRIELFWFEPSCFWGSPCLHLDIILLRTMQVKILSACCMSSSKDIRSLCPTAWIVHCVIDYVTIHKFDDPTFGTLLISPLLSQELSKVLWLLILSIKFFLFFFGLYHFYHKRIYILKH